MCFMISIEQDANPLIIKAYKLCDGASKIYLLVIFDGLHHNLSALVRTSVFHRQIFFSLEKSRCGYQLKRKLLLMLKLESKRSRVRCDALLLSIKFEKKYEKSQTKYTKETINFNMVLYRKNSSFFRVIILRLMFGKK